MREEVDFEKLEGVAGGKYVINGNTKQVLFRNVKRMFFLKGSPYTVMELMDGLIGQYETEEEYDNACIALLKENNLI